MNTERWAVDSGHSGLHFSVRHMMLAKVRGRFTRWSARIEVDGEDLAGARVAAVIDASSIESGLDERDRHLKSDEFLAVRNYPEVTFQSSRVKASGANRFRMTGDLCIRGTTREVVLDVKLTGRAKDPWGNERAGFTATVSLDRRDFGITWNRLLGEGGTVVGDHVDVEVEVEAVKQPAQRVA